MNFQQLIANAESLEQAGDITNQLSVPSDEPIKAEEHHIVTDVVEDETNLTSDFNDIDNISTGINEAEKSIETIDELKETLDEDDVTGVSPLTMTAVQVTHEAIMQSLGLSMSKPTVESFSIRDQHRGLIATLESSKEGIFNRIITGIKILIKQITEFIQNLLRNSWVLEKYRQFVIKKTNAVKASSPDTQYMKESAAAMSINGTAGASSIDPMYDTAIDFLKHTEALIGVVNRMNFNFKDDKDKLKDIFKDVPDVKAPARNVDMYGFLTRDRAVGITYGLIGGDDISHRKEFNHVPRLAEEIPVADMRTIKDLLDKSGKIISELKRIDGKRSIIRNITSRFLQAVVEVAMVYPSVVSKKAFDLGFRMQCIRKLRAKLNETITRFPLEAFKTAKAFIDYARHSLNHYKGEGSADSGLGIGYTEKSKGSEKLHIDEILDNENEKSTDNSFRPKFRTDRQFRNS